MNHSPQTEDALTVWSDKVMRLDRQGVTDTQLFLLLRGNVLRFIQAYRSNAPMADLQAAAATVEGSLLAFESATFIETPDILRLIDELQDLVSAKQKAQAQSDYYNSSS
jgi:hypothetical protein